MTINKVEFRNQYKYFSGTVSQMVLTSRGVLHSININRATTTAIINIYDCNTTTAATTTNLVIQIENPGNRTVFFDCDMTSGCFINPTGSGVNFTVSYRPL